MTQSRTASRGASAGHTALVVYRPLVEKVVAALGALVTHQIAYVLASVLATAVGAAAVPGTDHGHLSLQWAVVTPIAVAAASAFVLWQLRTLGFRSRLSARAMALMVVGFFLVQETIEGFVSGRSLTATLTHPAILIGVAVGPFVAWAMSRILAGVTEFAARFFADLPSFAFPGERLRFVPIPVTYRSANPGGRSRPRAPPSRLRI